MSTDTTALLAMLDELKAKADAFDGSVEYTFSVWPKDIKRLETAVRELIAENERLSNALAAVIQRVNDKKAEADQ